MKLATALTACAVLLAANATRRRSSSLTQAKRPFWLIRVRHQQQAPTPTLEAGRHSL